MLEKHRKCQERNTYQSKNEQGTNWELKLHTSTTKSDAKHINVCMFIIQKKTGTPIKTNVRKTYYSLHTTHENNKQIHTQVLRGGRLYWGARSNTCYTIKSQRSNEIATGVHVLCTCDRRTAIPQSGDVFSRSVSRKLRDQGHIPAVSWTFLLASAWKVPEIFYLKHSVNNIHTRGVLSVPTSVSREDSKRITDGTSARIRISETPHYQHGRFKTHRRRNFNRR